VNNVAEKIEVLPYWEMAKNTTYRQEDMLIVKDRRDGSYGILFKIPNQEIYVDYRGVVKVFEESIARRIRLVPNPNGTILNISAISGIYDSLEELLKDTESELI
jgi:hypothetical protein